MFTLINGCFFFPLDNVQVLIHMRIFLVPLKIISPVPATHSHPSQKGFAGIKICKIRDKKVLSIHSFNPLCLLRWGAPVISWRILFRRNGTKGGCVSAIVSQKRKKTAIYLYRVYGNHVYNVHDDDLRSCGTWQ